VIRVCVVGCGAIGGLYAAHLARLDDVEVWGYDVAQEHVDAINRDGLRLTGHTTINAVMEARSDARQIPPCEFGIVATKATSTRSAIDATGAVFRDAAVCSVQNGIGNEEQIAERVPRVMRGVCLPAGHVEAPGLVHMDASGDTWIGPFEAKGASMEEVRTLADAITRGGMNTLALDDARPAQWTKLLFNSATNPLSALTGLTHGQICTLPPLRELIRQLVAEGRAVADALGIGLENDPEVVIDQAARDNHDHKPSMLQDVLARRPTEIQALNGGIVGAGARAGVQTPLHAAITALITGLEQSWKETT
jgi:2-dehydropantoate 2-reductase